MRVRDLGIQIGDRQPGPLNAITDVPGVRVGHTTLIEGDNVRTGVTVIQPHEADPGPDPIFAGSHRLNGNGELTGLAWVRESGLLTTPIGLTNTHSVGVVRDALVLAAVQRGSQGDDLWSLPVVGETYDGTLNDINGMHVHTEHVLEALDNASAGPVAEGNVGGGTAMICHDFKGGIGTSSRVLTEADGGFTIGVLVQANHGWRDRFTVNGVPVGRILGPQHTPLPTDGGGPSGSIIAIVATDAPLLPHQCERVAQRVGLGVGRLGGAGENGSGDIFLCFATGNRRVTVDEPTLPVRMVPNARIDPYFYAVIEATEEAILNAMLQAETMTGYRGATVHRLDPEALRDVLDKHAIRR